MTIIIEGQTPCGLCAKVISAGDDCIGFPPIILDENSSLFQFNDGVYHASCIENDREGKVALGLLHEWSLKTGPGNRRCEVCGNQVTDHNDYLGIELLTVDDKDPLSRFNWCHLHQSCLSKWNEREALLTLISDPERQSNWGGQYLAQLAKDLSVGD